MTITIDGSPVTDQFANSANQTRNINITIGNNPNRMILVRINGIDVSNVQNPVTSVKIGSSSFTKAVESIGAESNNSTIWYLVNPPTGAQTVVVSYNADTSYSAIEVLSLYNVNQATPIGATATSTTLSISITPTNTGAWLFDSCFDNATTGSGPTAHSDTLDSTILISGTNKTGNTQHKTNPTIGSSNTMTYTDANFASGRYTAVEVIPAKTASVTDSASFTDTVSKTVTKNTSDSIALSESTQKSVLKAVSEIISSSDSINKAISKSVFDVITMIDSVSIKTEPIKQPISDTPAFLETVSKSINKTVSDAMAFSDSISSKSVTKGTNDVISISDGTNKSIAKILLENIIFSDIGSVQYARNIKTSDNITISEYVSKTIGKTANDIINSIDSLSKSIAKNITDSLGFVDTVAIARTVLRILMDSILVTDTVLARPTFHIFVKFNTHIYRNYGFKTVIERRNPNQ